MSKDISLAYTTGTGVGALSQDNKSGGNKSDDKKTDSTSGPLPLGGGGGGGGGGSGGGSGGSGGSGSGTTSPNKILTQKYDGKTYEYVEGSNEIIVRDQYGSIIATRKGDGVIEGFKKGYNPDSPEGVEFKRVYETVKLYEKAGDVGRGYASVLGSPVASSVMEAINKQNQLATLSASSPNQYASGVPAVSKLSDFSTVRLSEEQKSLILQAARAKDREYIARSIFGLPDISDDVFGQYEGRLGQQSYSSRAKRDIEMFEKGQGASHTFSYLGLFLEKGEAEPAQQFYSKAESGSSVQYYTPMPEKNQVSYGLLYSPFDPSLENEIRSKSASKAPASKTELHGNAFFSDLSRGDILGAGYNVGMWGANFFFLENKVFSNALGFAQGAIQDPVGHAKAGADATFSFVSNAKSAVQGAYSKGDYIGALATTSIAGISAPYVFVGGVAKHSTQKGYTDLPSKPQASDYIEYVFDAWTLGVGASLARSGANIAKGGINTAAKALAKKEGEAIASKATSGAFAETVSASSKTTLSYAKSTGASTTLSYAKTTVPANYATSSVESTLKPYAAPVLKGAANRAGIGEQIVSQASAFASAGKRKAVEAAVSSYNFMVNTTVSRNVAGILRPVGGLIERTSVGRRVMNNSIVKSSFGLASRALPHAEVGITVGSIAADVAGDSGGFGQIGRGHNVRVKQYFDTFFKLNPREERLQLYEDVKANLPYYGLVLVGSKFRSHRNASMAADFAYSSLNMLGFVGIFSNAREAYPDNPSMAFGRAIADFRVGEVVFETPFDDVYRSTTLYKSAQKSLAKQIKLGKVKPENLKGAVAIADIDFSIKPTSTRRSIRTDYKTDYRESTNRLDIVSRWDMNRQNKINNRINNRIDNRIDNKIDNRIDNRIDDRFDIRIDNRLDDKVDEKTDMKFDDRFDDRIDLKIDMPPFFAIPPLFPTGGMGSGSSTFAGIDRRRLRGRMRDALSAFGWDR
ncbi:MAG: hypothetical protein ABIK73_07330 [candidate division WOR-3 bacterium]